MQFPADATDDVYKRLRRIEGQVRGLQRMVQDGAECKDIVTQLSATRAALDRVGYKLISTALRSCVVDGASGEEAGAMDEGELEKLFLKLA